jgi:hypothetical protein
MSRALGSTKTLRGTKTGTRTSPPRSTKPSVTIPDIEARYPDLTSLTIVDLRDLRKKCVAEFDFDKSDAIQAYLDLIAASTCDSTIAQMRVWLASCCQAAIGAFQSNEIEFQMLHEDRELQVRREIQKLFDAMRARQRDALAVIEGKRFIARHKAHAPSSAVLELERLAREMALANNGLEAREAKQQADALYDREREANEAAVQKQFDALEAKLAPVHADEFALLEEKLRDSLARIQEAYLQEMKEQENRLVVAIRFHWRKAVEDVLWKLEAPARRVEITAAFKQLAAGLLEENKLERLLPRLEK